MIMIVTLMQHVATLKVAILVRVTKALLVMVFNVRTSMNAKLLLPKMTSVVIMLTVSILKVLTIASANLVSWTCLVTEVSVKT